MSGKPPRKPRNAAVASEKEGDSDAVLERFLIENHDAIEAKLQEARAEIADGKIAPLEPLPKLLREARRYAKARR
jgi:hypothetical protein